MSIIEEASSITNNTTFDNIININNNSISKNNNHHIIRNNFIKLSEDMPPVQVTFGAITEQNVEQLRKLNNSIFPVRYNDKFYKNILETPEDFTKYAYINGFVVGAICCRLEPSPNGTEKLYIMTLGVLAAYRGCGIGSRLLQSVLHYANPHPHISHIYLHVQTSNSDAIQFYKKFNFEAIELIKNYYKRIEPPDCYLLCKILHIDSYEYIEDSTCTGEIIIDPETGRKIIVKNLAPTMIGTMGAC